MPWSRQGSRVRHVQALHPADRAGESGETIKGVAVGVEAQRLADLFGKTALVTGKAVFRPSGSILRIEADRMEPGTGDVSLWAKAPTPVLGEMDTKSLHRAQGPRSGLSAIFGKWPGDESDEEVTEALETLS